VNWVNFRNFREALGVVRDVSDLAETEGHHPDIRKAVPREFVVVAGSRRPPQLAVAVRA
jgi:pterin-4a-carbinolamine dehydratase